MKSNGQRGAKWVLGILLAIILLIAGAMVIMHQVEKNELEVAEVGLKLAIADQEHENRVHALNVRYAELTEGPIAASKLDACYAGGYPKNHSLSRRQVAECDSILKNLDQNAARDKAKEKRKDAAYDKAHPVKK